MSLRNWLFRRRQREEDLDEEVQTHLRMAAQERMEEGETADQARASAVREFGNVTLVKEVTREMWGWNWLEHLVQDTRYGLRMLRKNPGFTAIAAITLALGIGANSAVFSLINSVMLRNLPVKDPGELVLFADSPRETMSINEPTPNSDNVGPSGQWTLFSYPLYRHLRDHSQSFVAICAFQTPEDTLTVPPQGQGRGGVAGVAQGKLVSGNFFSVLGVSAAIGRALTPEDDQPGAPPVAVVSFDYWRDKLGGEPGVVGRVLDIDGLPMTLVGVMPPGFFGERVERDSADFWMPLNLRSDLPLTVMPQAKSLLTNPNAYWLDLMGRLKPGVSMAQANVEINGELQGYLTGLLGTKVTTSVRQQIEHDYVTLAPGGRGLSALRYEYAEPLHILLAIVALVLLIACANVANLLLSRATARQKEMAMRLALGATRARLLWQLLVESALLAALGAVAGALFASWGVSVLVSEVAPKVPLNVRPDLSVLGFTMFISLLTVIFFGLAPGLKSTQVKLLPAIKGGSLSVTAQPPRLGLGGSLVAFQIAVSLLLLIGAGLLIRSLANLENQNLGFSPQHVLLVTVNPELAGYKSEQLPGLYQRLLDRVGALPGVRSASIGTTSPLSGGETASDISVEDRRQQQDEARSQLVAVGPRYFETEEMRIIAGRGISLQDTATSRPIAVINHAFARRFLPNGSPIGRRFSLGAPFVAPGFEIVGVVDDAKYTSAREAPEPSVFLCAFQMVSILPDVNEIEVRATGDPSGVTAEVRRAIQEVDSNLPITDVKTLTSQVNDSLAQQRAFSGLTGFFGILGLVIAGVGLNGIMANNAARRTNEIGIRMALGAKRSDVLWMVLRQTLVLIGFGIMIGIPVALAAARLIASQLYGLKPYDPPTITVAALVMAGVGLIAGYIPARRATKVDPIVALRYE